MVSTLSKIAGRPNNKVIKTQAEPWAQLLVAHETLNDSWIMLDYCLLWDYVLGNQLHSSWLTSLLIISSSTLWPWHCTDSSADNLWSPYRGSQLTCRGNDDDFSLRSWDHLILNLYYSIQPHRMHCLDNKPSKAGIYLVWVAVWYMLFCISNRVNNYVC